MKSATSIAAASLVLGLASATLARAETSVLSIQAPGFGTSQVLSWSWGAVNAGSSSSSGSGAGVGKPSFQDLALTRVTDSQSPKFLESVAKGTHLETVVLQNGAATLTLKNVFVTSYQTGDSSEKKSAQSESITLNFASFTYKVNSVTTGWDLRTNQQPGS
jgi:type VI protein secretion system component Hcp